MAGTDTRSQVLLARVAAALLIALSVLGFIWYGLSAEVQIRIWRDILDRPGGPMAFRFILQPTMAALAAFYDGVNDARSGRTPFLWALLTNSGGRIERLHEALISTARIILLGVSMDAIYQVIVLKTFYPGETVIVAILLAFIPYVLLRGPFARVARWWMERKHSGSPS
jgi:hypothetical protein